MACYSPIIPHSRSPIAGPSFVSFSTALTVFPHVTETLRGMSFRGTPLGLHAFTGPEALPDVHKRALTTIWRRIQVSTWRVPAIRLGAFLLSQKLTAILLHRGRPTADPTETLPFSVATYHSIRSLLGGLIPAVRAVLTADLVSQFSFSRLRNCRESDTLQWWETIYCGVLMRPRFLATTGPSL